MHIPDAARALDRDLRAVFGDRLRSLVVYEALGGDDRTATMAVADGLSAADLQACASLIAAWDDAGLATPLLVASDEFARALDAFPFEFGAILASHALVSGADPFAGLRVDPGHLRHACEIQARSHLLHLREGFLETRGRGDALADLVLRSAAPLAALVKSVARLDGAAAADGDGAPALVEQRIGAPAGSLARVAGLAGRDSVPSDEARRLFPAYLDAVQRLTAYVDRWSGA